MRLLMLTLLLIGCSEGPVSVDGMRIKEFEKTCLEGHVYFYNYGGQYGGSFGSIKLDANGKPVRCSMEVKELEK